MSDLFAAQMRDELDDVVDREIKRLMVEFRWRRHAAYYQSFFGSFVFAVKTTKEYLYGRYRSARSQIRGGANQASGGGAGAAGVAGAAVPQFSGYGGGFTGSAAIQGTSLGLQANAQQQAAANGLAVAVGPLTPPNCPTTTSTQWFEDAGIIAGEVRAYRSWRLGEDGLLRSVYMDHVIWVPGKAMEGDPDKSEGVHAFKSILLLAEYGKSYDNGQPIVTGEVELWGDVYEHERGYRASRASIVAIFDDHRYDAAEIRKRYGLKKVRVRKKK